ncbi:Amino Acid/Auxin Permease (AAAP) Family [Achlya hypogyna]|uniref:Amino Acid/Auxin Permease (AAAP) Family n=1 Tax=Achlya hypogyna TaxID=1202772 RepID=A0A1V9ZGV8_ACHHY|nr:Amino Acid/Auxin Permease (AAAP) Family [Achlya hypogyna]
MAPPAPEADRLLPAKPSLAPVSYTLTRGVIDSPTADDDDYDRDCERGVPIVLRHSASGLYSPVHNAAPRLLFAEKTTTRSSFGLLVGMTFMTLFMSVVGAGMLSIPYAFTCAPAWVVVAALVYVALSMAFSADSLVQVHIATQLSSFNALALAAGGPWFCHVVSLSTILAVFGACVGCLEIVHDLGPFLWELLGLPASEHSATVVLLVFVSVMYPLTLLKKLSALRFSSYIGFAASIYLVVAIVAARYGRAAPVPALAAEPAPSLLTTAHLMSMFNYAFVMHLNVVPLYDNLRQATHESRSTPGGGFVYPDAAKVMTRIIFAMSTVCILLYTLFGWNAHAMYGDDTDGNILLNLEGEAVMQLPRVAVLATILFSFPLIYHPLLMLCESFTMHLLHPTAPTAPAAPRPARAAASILLLALLLFVAAVMPGIQVTFSLTGASCVTLICYIFPGVCYLRLVPHGPAWRKAAMSVVMGVAAVVGAIATVLVCLGTEF